MLSRRRMIWLISNWLLPPPSVSKLSYFVSLVELLTVEGVGRNQIIRPREGLVLYNPLATLWIGDYTNAVPWF
jgi:hypothetical protein